MSRWIPDRKVLAGGASMLAAWLLVQLVVMLGVQLDITDATTIVALVGSLAAYLVPPSAQDILKRIDGELRTKFGDPPPAEPGTTLQAAPIAVLLAVGVAILLLGACAAGSPVTARVDRLTGTTHAERCAIAATGLAAATILLDDSSGDRTKADLAKAGKLIELSCMTPAMPPAYVSSPQEVAAGS